jgi:hypothetical protein
MTRNMNRVLSPRSFTTLMHNLVSMNTRNPVLHSHVLGGHPTVANGCDVIVAQKARTLVLGMKTAMVGRSDRSQMGDVDTTVLTAKVMKNKSFGNVSSIVSPSGDVGEGCLTTIVCSRPSVLPTATAKPEVTRRLVSTINHLVNLRHASLMTSDETTRHASNVPLRGVSLLRHFGALAAPALAVARYCVHRFASCVEVGRVGQRAIIPLAPLYREVFS